MNLYSNKQKWKIVLLLVATLLIGASLFISDQIVRQVAKQETQRAKQWAEAIRKKAELIELTTETFTKLREREKEKIKLWIDASKEIAQQNSSLSIPEFPMQIVKNNKDIPVILLDNHKEISGYRNIGFEPIDLKKEGEDISEKNLNVRFEDSLHILAAIWTKKNPQFTVEVYKGLFMTYVYDDSKEITRLENARDSLLHSFNEELIDNEGLIPVLLINQEDRSIIGTNIPDSTLSVKNINEKINAMSIANDSLVIQFNNQSASVLYYDRSDALKRLNYFPYIQFVIIGLFVFIAYLLFSTFRKAEQNQVWAGMAKETAHQLGTPLSSLIAWNELLREMDIDQMIVTEIGKDIQRLETVTDRFSKIGSIPKMEIKSLTETTQEIIDYLKPRTPRQITITSEIEEGIVCAHSPSLITWVLENITKNAMDAMEGKGELDIRLYATPEWAHLLIQDNGKGITQKQIRSIFKPGFTTKKRGWGLGLSLSKRIVHEYHKGKIYVLESKVGQGTTFKIDLPL